MVELRVPKLFNLRSDPFEQADHNSIYYNDWLIRRVFLLVPAQGFVAQWISELQGVPAEPEARQLQHRPGHGEADGGRAEEPLARHEGLPCASGAVPSSYVGVVRSEDSSECSERRIGGRRARLSRRRCMPSTSGCRIRRRSPAWTSTATCTGTRTVDGRSFILLWPAEPLRGGQEILVAGCGTSQAAQLRASRAGGASHRHRHQRDEPSPHARSAAEVRPGEPRSAPAADRATSRSLGARSIRSSCTGVLHHLPDPDLGLRALRDVLESARAPCT